MEQAKELKLRLQWALFKVSHGLMDKTLDQIEPMFPKETAFPNEYPWSYKDSVSEAADVIMSLKGHK